MDDEPIQMVRSQLADIFHLPQIGFQPPEKSDTGVKEETDGGADSRLGTRVSERKVIRFRGARTLVLLPVLGLQLLLAYSWYTMAVDSAAKPAHQLMNAIMAQTRYKIEHEIHLTKNLAHAIGNPSHPFHSICHTL